MNFIISAMTDVGTMKSTNQDGLSAKVIRTMHGEMVFAIICDGVGGLSNGEVASASVIRAFHEWVYHELPALSQNPIIEDSIIKDQWMKLVVQQSEKIRMHGLQRGIQLGTTAVVMLLTQNRYYIMNVGDSRAYQITSGLKQITNDHTFVAREIALGRMTEEEALKDDRRHALLQCIGVSETIYPDMFFGDIPKDGVFMLCSDGFRNEISKEELFARLQPSALLNENLMNECSKEIIELVKMRQETDNISVVLVRTF
jgi:serine/threonine protein phosphatase PrpC